MISDGQEGHGHEHIRCSDETGRYLCNESHELGINSSIVNMNVQIVIISNDCY